MKSIKISMVLLTVIFLTSCGQNSDLAKTKKYVNLLKEKGLYKQAVEELRLKSEIQGLSEKEKAGLLMELGDIYREDIKDYESALGSYYKARLDISDSLLWRDLTERIIDCLEKTGNKAEAAKEKAALETAASAVMKGSELPAPKKGVVAVINEREITKAELDNFVSAAPIYVKENYKDSEKRMEVLEQFLSQEVFYEAAKRQKLDEDPQIAKRLAGIKKSMMVQLVMEKEGGLSKEPTDEDLKKYYDNHPDSFKKKDANGKETKETFENAKAFIKAIYGYDKEKNTFNNLLQKYMKTEKVTVFAEELKK